MPSDSSGISSGLDIHELLLLKDKRFSVRFSSISLSGRPYFCSLCTVPFDCKVWTKVISCWANGYTILPAFTLGDSIQFGIAFSQVLYHLRVKKPTVRILQARAIEDLVIRILTDLAQWASRLWSTRLESLGLLKFSFVVEELLDI